MIEERRNVRRLAVLAIALGLLTLPNPRIMPSRTAVADDAPANVSLRQTVQGLLEKLDSQALAERAQAERGLLDLGPDVLTYLPAPELITSVSVREAIKRIRIQLERRAARESAQASHVQLTGDVAVGEILKQITTQTRNRVELSEDARSLADQTVRVDFENRPFWQCLDDLCDRLKLHAAFNPQRNTLSLRGRLVDDPAELVVQRSGPFRMAIHAANVRPVVGDDAHRLLRISGKLRLEPRLRPLFVHFAAKELSASESSGKAIPSWNPEARYELPVGDAGREVPVQFDYLVPISERQLTVNLKGRISLQLAAGAERILFDRTSQVPGAMRRRGGVTVRLTDVNVESLPDQRIRTEIKVVVSYDAGGPAFESHRTWMFHNAVYLEEDDAVNRIDYTDFDTSLELNGAVGVDYRWNNIPGPPTRYRFVYEAPTLIMELPLNIDLKEIPVKAGD